MLLKEKLLNFISREKNTPPVKGKEKFWLRTKKEKWLQKKILGKLTKRQQFAFLTTFATAGLVATQLVPRVDLYLPMAFTLAFFAALGAFILFRPDLRGLRIITSLILISFYTWAVAFFYFLLPVRWLTRLPTAILFGIGFYAILLTENIYTIATGRTIQLLRAGRSIGLLMTLTTVFLLFETVISLHLNMLSNVILLFIISSPLAFQSLWSMELDVGLNRETFFQAVILGIGVSEVGLGLAFWPGNGTIQALFLTTFFYVIVDMSQQALIDRLFLRTIREYISVIVIVFILVLVTTSWGG